MKRLGLALVLALFAPSLFAFDASPAKGDRVAVLMSEGRDASRYGSIDGTLRKYLVAELRKNGYDAYLSRDDYSRMDDQADANGRDDYYVEVFYADGSGDDFGGVGAYGSNGVGAEISVVSAHVAAEVRLYDRSLQLIRSLKLDAHAVTPTISSIGIGGRDGFLSFELPFMRRAPYRIAAHQIARDAAAQIASTND